ncbi:MAG: PEGA domain-containing protein [Deltaproteobacteria bacterium]|nr:MAG: PEGA domain-containing protein [Deltaproteobacteria bacterium]
MIEMQPDTSIQFGTYEIFRKLALGGMAELYLAKQRGVGGFERTVVIKCILPQYATDPQFVTMFLDEARIASQLNHPNIVQIYEIGEVNGLYYISMEYVRGPNFKALRKALYHQSKTVNSSLVAGIMVQVCAGLHHAHCATDPNGNPLQIVHRDVSPTNLLLTFEGNAKLVDFGVAKASIQEHQTKAGMVKGKYRYMSPEQILAHPIDHRSDIYALGAILYELSTGVVLFQRRSEAETIRAVYMDPIIPPGAVIEDYPPELERIVMKALEREARDRYQSADEMRRDLEQFLYDYGVYYGPQQLAESLRGMFTQVFESSINEDPGSALTRNDYARFGLSIPPSGELGRPSAQAHTMENERLPEEVTSPSADPSSPSSFHAPTESSAPSGLNRGHSGSGHSIPPTRDLQSYSSVSRPQASHPSLAPQQAATDPIPVPSPGSLQRKEKSSFNPLLLVLLLLVVSGGVAVGLILSNPSKAPQPSSQADVQLQRLAGLLQDKQWKQADALLQVIRIKDLTPRQKEQRIALQKQLHRGQTLELAQQLYQQGKQAEARKTLQALQTRYPEDKTLAALAEQWKQPTTTEPKKPVTDNPDDDTDDNDDDTTPKTKPRRRNVRPRRRVNRPRRRIRRRRTPRRRVARRVVEPRRVVAEPPPRRPEFARPGILFVPAVSMARVDLDGSLFGYTPINGKSVPPGRHTIRVSRPGYKTVVRTIMVRSDKRLIVPITMERIRPRQVPPRLPPLPRNDASNKPKPKLAFSSVRLPRSGQTLRIVIIDRRGISGNTYTYQFRSLCRRIERETQRVLGSSFSVRGVTFALQKYVRRVANLSGRERMTFYPRAIAYVIYRNLGLGRSRSRVAQLLLSYQKRNKFKKYRNR